MTRFKDVGSMVLEILIANLVIHCLPVSELKTFVKLIVIIHFQTSRYCLGLSP